MSTATTAEERRARLTEFVGQLALTLVFCTVIAILMTLLTRYGLLSNLKFSFSIGLSIHLLSIALCAPRGMTRPDLKTALIAIPLGACIGFAIGGVLNGLDPRLLISEHPSTLLISLFMALIFGTAISYYFHARGVIAEATAAARLAALERAAYESRLAESNLKMLQAQIEPHFLFNTLANVLSLIRDEPLKAERMLEDFIGYLRGALNRSRSADVTLADELELLRAYLDIQSIRMGERLRYAIEAPPELLDIRLPALLIQPLVENAIKHGLEPKPEGGELTVRISRDAAHLTIEVADTGLGIDMTTQPKPGIGLENIRERLNALHREDAKLQIETNQPCGVKATLVIPLDAAS